MFTGTNYPTIPAITTSFTLEYHKSKVSGGFTYLKPDVRNTLSPSNFSAKPSKFSWKAFLSKSSSLSGRCLRPVGPLPTSQGTVTCLRMPEEVPIFSQGKYETGCMPYRCDGYQSFQKDVKTVMEFWEDGETRAPVQRVMQSEV